LGKCNFELIMSISTEQQVIDNFYPDDTKTISDVITEFRRHYSTDTEVIEFLKQLFPSVSDWSV